MSVWLVGLCGSGPSGWSDTFTDALLQPLEQLYPRVSWIHCAWMEVDEDYDIQNTVRQTDSYTLRKLGLSKENGVVVEQTPGSKPSLRRT
ncbi:hypothetical protein V5799_032759 [Amblyomma americanum]|uniref:Uncharacterized protein n=1 Tax=Amblyomma americanum TaxID=6943 RepID=A0AAQ4DQ90_AMBAM